MKIVERGKSVAINLCIMALAVAVSLTGCSGGGASVQSPNASITVPGKKYVCMIAEDGTVHDGRFEDNSFVEKKGIKPAGPEKPANPDNTYVYFDSFPDDKTEGTDYVWDGYTLKYSPVRKIDGKYVSTSNEVPKQPAWDDPNYGEIRCTEVVYCQIAQNGRLYSLHYARIANLPLQFSEGTIFFTKFPVYLGNGENFIWDGHTLTYDSINK